MPIQSTIYRSSRYVQTTCTESIILNEILEYQEDIWKNGDIPGFNEIFDAQQADFSLLSMADILQVCQNSIKINVSKSKSKLAFVINTKAQQEMADFYRSIREIYTDDQREVQVFFTLDDAFNWLQKSTSEVDKLTAESPVTL